MKLSELKGKYVGANQIKKATKSKNVTYLGSPKIKLEYESSKTEEFPEECINNIVTDKVSDASSLRELRVIPVVEKILILLTESELSLDDIGYAIGPKLTFSIQDSITRVMSLMFKKEIREASIHGKVNLKDIDNILDGQEDKKAS